jgi:PAS domain S-box-containing protein
MSSDSTRAFQDLKQSLNQVIRQLLNGEGVDWSSISHEALLGPELSDTLQSLAERLDKTPKRGLEPPRSDYILDGAGLGSWDWWLESNEVHFDERWCEMLGLDPQQTPQKLSTWETRVHPDDIAQAYADIQAYLEGKTECYENIHRMQHADGHWVWILDRGRISEYDQNAKAVRFTGTHFDITDYKEKELLSDMIQEIAGVGGWELDAQSGQTRWTRETYHIHGLPENTPTDQIMGINFYAPHERERITQCIRGALKGVAYRETFEFIDAHNTLKWVEATGQPILDAEGKVYKVLGTFQDISEQKQRLLKHIELTDKNKKLTEHMAAILNHAPIVSYECLLDSSGTINYVSPYIYEVTGYTAEDFTHNPLKTLESIIHPEDRARVTDAIDKALKKNRAYDVKYRIIHADGSPRWIHRRGRTSQHTGTLLGVIIDITEQEKHSTDLRNIFEHSEDMLCIANNQGYFLRVSPSFIRILGYSEKELLSQPYMNFVVPDDVTKTSSTAKEISSGVETLRFENRYKCKNGKITIMSWNARRDPKTGLIYAIVRDVTKQRNMEHKNQQILEVIERAWIVSEADAQGKIIYANKNFSDVSQYSLEELLGQDHRLLNSNSHPKEFFTQMWARLKAGGFWQGQIENRRKDGEHYFVNTVIAPIKDMVTGNIISYFSVRQDISREITTNSILAEAEHAGQFGSFRLNLRTHKAEWSKGHNHILGLDDTQEPSFELYLSRVHPSDRGVLTSTLETIRNEGLRSFRIRYRIVMPDQSIKFIESFGRVIFSKDDQPELIVGIILDVSEQHAFEKRVEEQRVHMIHTSKLASLGEMSAGVAHEINNPLSIIMGNLPLLRKYRNHEEKFVSKLEAVSKSAQRIEKIVSGLRKFSRTSEKDAHKLESLNEIINEVILLTEAKAKSQAVIVEAILAPDLYINCAVVEIEQVLVNLVNNSVDAIQTLPDKWIKIVSRVEGEHILIQVIDSGRGIAPEVVKRLYEPFFTTKAVGAGTGLGLSISRGILMSHGASLELHRKHPNTCFEIRFPAGVRLNHGA